MLGLLMLAREQAVIWLANFGTRAFRFQLQPYLSATAIPSVVDARNLGGVDFADFDETKMRLPGIIAQFAEAARESSPTEVVTDG